VYFFDTKNKCGYKFYDKKTELIANDKKSLIDVLKSVEKYTSQGFYIAGFISYEAGCYLVDKQISHKELSMPLLYFVVFKKISLLGNLPEVDYENGIVYDIKYSETSLEYAKKITKIKEHLHNGDTYQTNYTFRYSFKSLSTPENLYYYLCKKQNAEFTAFLEFENYSIVSLSPELFLKKTDNILISKPMKGTWKIGDKPDDKIITENGIIVDLIRNDMSVIAEKGTVEAVNPFEVQTFNTLDQMISTVKCEIKNKSFYDIIKALFPCGSITGAPKIRTMEIISDLENNPRDIYCGSIGYILPNNDFCFNVAIRTAVYKNKEYIAGIGGGIIYESKTNDEFDECLLKSQFLRSINDFEIFETMKSIDGIIQNLDFHLARLKKSMQYFGFNSKNIVFPQIDYGAKKVRLSVKQNGEYDIKISDIDKILTNKVVISDIIIDAGDIFLQHKTSRRKIYNTEYQKYNVYDVIFINNLGFISEASRNNIFIKKQNQWITPPLLAGILSGIMRQIFMETTQVLEKNITLDELKNADEVWLSNSINGLIKVEL
jgi:para-aminobenzoate synthetase/4-amino-4-deoxychorismate lyase